MCIALGIAPDGIAAADSIESLRGKYSAMQDKLGHNQFQRPVYIESSESAGAVTGSIYALINDRFAMVGEALNNPTNWCDILLLHLNTKYCRASSAGGQDILNVVIGKKYDQPLDEAYPMAFAYRVAVPTPQYLHITLSAAKGPLGTRNYRIVLEATPLANGQTFMHLSYSYAYGFVGRLAMQTYLNTVARNKIGFTVARARPDGQITPIRGMRGVVERNTMRYYLAIEAFLGAVSQPPQARLEKRLHDWFAAVERYPRQLHELDEREYLDMKRREFRAAAPAVKP
jgi:hypothetical protein